jgi:hypothetical protein
MNNWDRYFYDLLEDGLAAAGSVAVNDREAAISITDGLVANALARDPKQSDRMTRYATKTVLDTVLDLIGSRWYTFKVKAKLLFYSI